MAKAAEKNIVQYEIVSILFPFLHQALLTGGAVWLANFQVEAPVTRRSPHRPVREDFPHTVPWSPEALRQWRTQQATPRWAHNFAVLQFCPVLLNVVDYSGFQQRKGSSDLFKH
jgi:hypothetical protein